MTGAPLAAEAQAAPRRVLIVDDSAVARAMMTRMIDGSDQLAVVGAVPDAGSALRFLGQARVDAIVLDIQMPGVDGLTALPDLLRAAGAAARVLVVSATATDGAAATVQALALGAADTLVKPTAGGRSGAFAQALVDKLERLVATDAPPPPPAAIARAVPAPARAAARPGGDAFDVVVIGASTGGIHALSRMLQAIGPDCRLPMIVTQHLPASFMPYYAAQLSVLAGRPCEVADDGTRVRPGRMLVAPGDAHLRFVSTRDGGSAVRLLHEPASSGCLPSVDPMMRSAAQVFGSRTLAVMLSGMGRDGFEGARAVHAAGGCVLAQDRQSSVVWGMPGSVAAAGIADAVLSPEEIGALASAGRRP